MSTHPFPTQNDKEEAIKSFPFFSLPLELRLHIYSELLIPSIPSSGSVAEPRIVWHDRHGLQKRIPVYPQILLASKQTNTEAASILYDNNILKIDISSPIIELDSTGHYPDWYGSTQYLFRSDVPQRYFDGPGDIYPHCLRRIANIEVISSTQAIWVSSTSGYYFSHIGDLLVEVLKVLAQDDEVQQRKEPKRLLLTVHKDYYDDCVLDLFPRKSQGRAVNEANFAARTEMADQIPRLLEEVAKTRKVEIVEDATFTRLIPSGEPRFRTRDIDLKNIRDL